MMVMRFARWFLCSIGLLCAIYGCQHMPPPHAQNTTINQSSFMDLWKVYTHCQTSHDPEAILVDAMRLNQASRIHQPDLPSLLRPVKPFVSDPPTRLAVDPKAMAAACTLRAGQAATAIGWNDLAITLYQSLLRGSPDSRENYYAKQAHEGLAEVRLRQSSRVAPESMSPHRPARP